MSESMEERVARAICKSVGTNPDMVTHGTGSVWFDADVRKHFSKSEAHRYAWQDYVGAARAAISAMREPTHAMLVVGADARINRPPDDDTCAPTWRAMIDAALKP